MKSKPAVGMLVLLSVGLITWSLTTTLAAGITGGREAFLDWRAENTTLFFGIWFVEVVVIGLPVLWFVGRRMSAYAQQQDKSAVEARGVGRLAGAALRGDKKAIERLVKLLDDGSPAVKYQSARALALLDDKAIDEELFRKVRYWEGNQKLGLIDTLRRTMDVRTVKILRMLGSDRNPMVARKARSALAIVSSRSGNIDGMVAKRRKEAQAKTAKAERKKAKRAAPPEEPPPAGQSKPAAARPNKPAAGPGKPAAAKPAGSAAVEQGPAELPATAQVPTPSDTPAPASQPSAPAPPSAPSAPSD
jgi:hypothetical protein